jgi:isopenicillin N synthase-like dioxygenase
VSGDDKNRGIDAVNQDFARYEQVKKEQRYRLAESSQAEEFDHDYRIATCDLARFTRGDREDRRRFAEELGEALSDIGFAILENTGIDASLYDEAELRVCEFFEGPSHEEKRRFRAQRFGAVNQGWFPFEETSDIHPDLVEAWVFCRRAFAIDEAIDLSEFWPRPELEPFFRKLCLEQLSLAPPVMQAILQFLRVDPHLFDRRLDSTNFGLRLNYYPPISGDTGAGRLLGHEDVDLFTLLPAPRIEGLQVLNRKNGKWVRLSAPRGAVILNVGDYLQRISNDRLPSTTHRVSKPRDPAVSSSRRTSFPLNIYLWESETLEVLPGLGTPKYPPIGVLEFHTAITSKYYGDDYAVKSE